MYIGHYDHGTLLVYKGSRQQCEHEYGERLKDLNLECEAGTLSYVLVIPRRMDYECSTHAGQYASSAVPCICVTMQSEPPVIPDGW